MKNLMDCCRLPMQIMVNLTLIIQYSIFLGGRRAGTSAMVFLEPGYAY